MTYMLGQDAYNPISQDLRDALKGYLNHGIMPDEFLTAVLENNLYEAFGRSDGENCANLKNIVKYIHHNVPSCAWGSRLKIKTYQESLRVEATCKLAYAEIERLTKLNAELVAALANLSAALLRNTNGVPDWLSDAMDVSDAAIAKAKESSHV